MTEKMAGEKFDGAGAMIFGGANGIGRAVAMEWARRGARLVVADIDCDAAKVTAAEIVSGGGQAVGVRADVMSDDSVAAAIAEAEKALGAIDILMNNVGAILNGHPEDIPIAEWQRIMDLNYLGSVRATIRVLPKFLERGSGHIVNTASFAGFYPYAASRIPYAASKAAIIAYSQSLALYCEPAGVSVSCLIPGPVQTGVMNAMTSWTEDCPMRGPGRETTLMLPEAVAVALSDGMNANKILIPSDDVAFGIVQRWAASPDGFVRSKIDEFGQGDPGIPTVPEHILALHAR